jgi:hypothetical protein
LPTRNFSLAMDLDSGEQFDTYTPLKKILFLTN